MKKELALYELVLLTKLPTVEQDLMGKIDYYRDFLIDKGCQVMVKNHGKVSLAYPIKGLDTANSIQLIYLGNGTIIKQLNTEIQRDEFILRSLTTKIKDNESLNEIATVN